MDFLLDYYSLIKALHVIFVIYWMAGLLMIPRFYVYHFSTEPGSADHIQWCEREARLFKIILNPALVLSLIFGLMMMMASELYLTPWFWLKSIALLGMFAFHDYMARLRPRFEAGERPRSEKFFRMMNEIPSLLIIVIVLLAILKPF